MANKRKKSSVKTDKKIIIVRIICIVLALLMFTGVIVAAVISAQAVETDLQDTGKQVFNDTDYLVRVGISFGDDTLDSHRVRTQNGAPGFDLYETTTSSDLKYIWTLECNDVSVSETGNLRKSSSSDWYYYASSSNTAAGGYHLQIKEEYASAADAKTRLDEITDKAKNLEIPVYPAYIGGKYYIRVGAFTSVSQAESEKSVIEKALGCKCDVVSPTASGVTVLDYNTAVVLFDFDMTEQKYGLGLCSLDEDGVKDYIKTVKGYYFDGVMEFRRYKASGVDGVTMILISELESYVMSVVPWEIYNTWPLETLKAFSICARTYVVANSRDNAKHKSHFCDVCTTGNCQVCRGLERVNDNLRNAVTQTKGQILLCDGKTATTFYCSLGGGSMAGIHEVWNTVPVKYLVGHMTPWEDLTASKFGAWSFTVTPTELLKIVRSGGYTTLTGAIADVKINRLCENSTYVYSITITDIYGVSVTVNRTISVRGALAGLMYAANFVIEHNGKIDDGRNGVMRETISGIYVMTADGIKMIDGEEGINVITDSGVKKQYLPQRITVKTSSSLVSQTVLISTMETVHQMTGSAPEDFTFIGSGNGHGVGASQYGCNDLGKLGYSYDQILLAYFPHTEIVDYLDYLSN